MILYTAEQILVGQILVWWFKRWLARDVDKEAGVEIPTLEAKPVHGGVVEEDNSVK
jgi:hypothetical protein